MRGDFCALRARRLFFLCCLGRLRRGLGCRGHARRALQKKLSKACTLRVGLCALRARRLFLFVVWAASGEGKAGPVMGLRPLLGPPCIPPEAPRWGFPVSDISRGLRGFRSGSFLASLGDLPARRAMPAYPFALDARPRASHWLLEVTGMAAGYWERLAVMKWLNFGSGL